MGYIADKIEEFIRNMLTGWVMGNLEGMFEGVNSQVGDIAGEVIKTPQTFNPGIFSTIQTLSDTVIIPISGIIITYVLCYELITMVIDKNNMHEFDTSLFFRYLFKACIAVVLLSKTSDFVMAMFDVGANLVGEASRVITGNGAGVIDVEQTLKNMFDNQVSTMEIGGLVGLGIETMLVRFCLNIISLAIFFAVYTRIIEVYLYISVAPIPFATLVNREWGSIGSNYIKACLALALQGFFMMVCVAIYTTLVNSLSVANNLHTALWELLGYTALLCMTLLKTNSISKAILGAH